MVGPPSSSISAPTIRAPSFAKRFAVALPIPDATPVISTTFPSKRFKVNLLRVEVHLSTNHTIGKRFLREIMGFASVTFID